MGEESRCGDWPPKVLVKGYTGAGWFVEITDD
jgi:hypothetical protein